MDTKQIRPAYRGINQTNRYFKDWNIVDIPFDSIDMVTKMLRPVSRLVPGRQGWEDKCSCDNARYAAGRAGTASDWWLVVAAYSDRRRMHTKKAQDSNISYGFRGYRGHM
jgi:hypothetical protein